MVKQFFLDVAKQIDSGEYFKDARGWYHTKYNFPVIERSFCIMFSLVAFIIALFCISIYNSFFPLINKIPVAIKIENTVTTHSQLKRLSQSKTTNPNKVLQEYFLLQFVKSYENYTSTNNHKELIKDRNFIKQYASKEVIKQHNYLTSIQNPDGYLIQYRNGHRLITLRPSTLQTKTLPVKGTTADQDPETIEYTNIHLASIEFIVDEIYNTGRGEEIVTINWRTNMRYQYSNLTYNYEEEDFNVMDFKILSYNSTEIN